MKNLTSTALTLASMLTLTTLASAQTEVTTTTAPSGATTSVSTTTTTGTVSEIGGDALVIRSETSPQPIRYSFTRSTSYVDETGAPVSLEMVRSGLPVTVHYARVGDQMVA